MSLNSESEARKSKIIRIRPEAASNNAALLDEINSRFSITEANGFAKYVNYSSLSEEPVHRWFKYREGYSLQLVRELIRDLPRGSVILDPFCGCGTTLVAAQELGFTSYGFEINPLAALVTRVKTRLYSQSQITELRTLHKSLQQLRSNCLSDPKPGLSIIDKVFHPEILHALLVYRRYIKTITDTTVRDFVFVAWLSILEDVSNVYKEGNGIKYRNRKRTPNGYVTLSDSEWQKKIFPSEKFDFVKKRLSEHLAVMLKDLEHHVRRRPRAEIYEWPAERLSQKLPPNSVALAVFSPPYCNCFNYFKIFKIELWMGEFISSYKELQELNRTALRSHVETVMERAGDVSVPYVNAFTELIDGGQLWDSRIPKAVQGYFIDMKAVLEQLHHVLKPSGKCIIVVGNSSYAGILIPTDALLARLAEDAGFRVDRIAVARHLTTSSQQKLVLGARRQFLRESLLILEKPDPRLQDKKIEYVKELPRDPKRSGEHIYVIGNNGLTELTHKFHRFPGKFIPHIPRWALLKYLPNKRKATVLDPFCGSGTTLVETLRSGHNALGVDIDPIARLLSQVKTTRISPKKLRLCVEDVRKRICSKKTTNFRPGIPTLTHWFSESAALELGIIREVIERYSNDTDVYNFLLVCFLSVIRRASKADNETQKTYVSHTYRKVPESAKELFLIVLEDYSKRMIDFAELIPKGCSAEVLSLTDARSLTSQWRQQGRPLVDLAITSPPYVKTVDYIYNQMAEYFWIGDLFGLETQLKQNIAKQQYMGTQAVRASVYESIPSTGIESIDALSQRINKKDQKNAYIVAKYFLDLKQHLREMHSVLKKRAHYVMVVGDSIINNEPILVHKYTQLCAREAGFDVESVFGYEIRNRHMRFPRRGRGGIVRYDWIIDLERAETK